MTVKYKVLETLLGSQSFISGQELADSLGVSRNAVWKAVKSLQSDGYTIEAVNNKGYRIDKNFDIITESIIKKTLTTITYGKNMTILGVVDSTNTYAKKIALKSPDGTVIISDTQTGGRGRMGRNFFSPEKTGIYMSVIIKPDISITSAQLITSCVAVAVSEAIERVCETDVQIKWVNDLYINGKKICGILTEASMSFEENKLDYAVVGIGINVGKIKFPPELENIATSIENETGEHINRNRLCAEILNRFEAHMRHISERYFMPEYRRRSFIIGKKVSVMRNGAEETGEAVAIDENANLIVKFGNGEEYSANSGEARIIK